MQSLLLKMVSTIRRDPITSNVARSKTTSMADDQYRSLLTDREREIINGDADVSEGYYYRVVSRVRRKINGIERDLQVLENHDSLADELRDVVCENGGDE